MLWLVAYQASYMWICHTKPHLLALLSQPRWFYSAIKGIWLIEVAIEEVIELAIEEVIEVATTVSMCLDFGDPKLQLCLDY